MDIYKLASKLEPLMPQDVAHWLNALEYADNDLKNLIEQEIVHHAHERLGDFRNKLLLSLPSQSKARGTFNLGTIMYEKEKYALGISKEELLQNLAIFGRSGAGKTNVAFHLLNQLVEKKVPFLFLDWKRTARHLLPTLQTKIKVYTAGRSLSPFPFNPFIPPPGVDHHVYIGQLVDVLADAYTLGDGAKSILQKTIQECYVNGKWPHAKQILAKVEDAQLKGRAHGWQTSSIRALQALAYSLPTTSNEITPEQLATSLLNQNTVVELDSLDQGAKQFLIPMLSLWLYYYQLAQREREQLQLTIFIEEAHHVLYRQEQRKKETVMNMLLRQCREIGIGIIVIDQHPHLISTAALGNTYTSICMNQKDPSDINKAASLSLVEADEKKYFSMLPVGQGIVKLQDRWTKPVLVNFPLIEIKKGLVTDELLLAVLSGSMTGSALKRAFNHEFGQEPRVRVKEIVLGRGSLEFLEDIVQHKDDGVKKRYRRLGISVDKGMRVKDSLIKSGIIEEQEIQVGRIRTVLVRVTKVGREALGLVEENVQFGSIAHEYWKNFYANKFKQEGYRVVLEATRKLGQVDVLAIKGKDFIAIEIETGKSDIPWNVKQDLRSGFNKIIVVATDDKAMAKIEYKLAKTGLLITGRIEIVMRDKLDMTKLSRDLANEADARGRAEASKQDAPRSDPKRKPPMVWPPWWYIEWWPCSQRTAVP